MIVATITHSLFEQPRIRHSLYCCYIVRDLLHSMNKQVLISNAINKENADQQVLIVTHMHLIRKIVRMLREIGFWTSTATEKRAGDDFPDPRRLVDEQWKAQLLSAERSRLKWYLTRGAFVESHELAYSYCRFEDCQAAMTTPKVMGACTMTDGVYCWPEGYWHYVDYHGVRPPADFLAHVVAHYNAHLAVRQAFGDEELIMWDYVEQKPVWMPSGMKEWIVTNTTLREEAL